MKKNDNAGLAREQRNCARSGELQEAPKQDAKTEFVKCISGHEVLPNRGLREVGKFTEYNGGFRFGAGSVDYREMSAKIARMGERTGHNFCRSGKKLSAQFLLGLPDNEFFGICYPAYKHDKRLPSVAMVDATQTAANLQYHYEAKVLGHSQLVALTLPALESRTSIEGYQIGLDVAFKRINKLKRSIKKACLGDFLYVQLEDPFDAKSETFYLHFHVFLSLENGDANRRKLLEFLKYNTPWLDSTAGICLKRVGTADVAKSIRYGTKPSTTAYQIAASGNETVFAEYLKATAGKRTTRTEGHLKETLQDLKQQGRRTKFYQCGNTGRLSVGLVQKVGKTGQEQTSLEKRKATLGSAQSPTPKSKSNIFCGSGRPVPSPDGRLRAFGIVQNFCLGAFDIEAGKGKSGSLFEANRSARRAWEINTQTQFDVRAFLAPIAKDLNRLLAGNEVQSYTIIASPGIIKVLGELKENSAQKPNKGKSGSNWSSVWTRIRRMLRDRASVFVDLVSWLRDLKGET